MINLLIHSPNTEFRLNQTNFGGLPVQNKNQPIEWPICSVCAAEMQYLGKVKTDLGLELIFMCCNDPGLCDEWDADGGANAVIVVKDENLEHFSPSNPELGIRKTEYATEILEIEAEEYEAARAKFSGKQRAVLGQIFGKPSWIQGEETPNCDCCNAPMRFVAQLEEGPDYQTAMNFGGGIAYLFDCPKDNVGKFLWQS